MYLQSVIKIRQRMGGEGGLEGGGVSSSKLLKRHVVSFRRSGAE